MHQNLSFMDRLIARRTLMLAMCTVLACMPIGHLSAGGYVDGGVALEAATSINTGAVSVSPTFNNDQFNDKVLVGTVNNDPIRTPSTADPVSTVSGNNYHDETDVQIKGRNGLNYVFTRTYNSAPSATGVDRGLGFGWAHSYGMRLRSNDFGICPNCTATENTNSKTSSVTYTDERGGEQNFLVNETTFAVTNPKGVYDTLALDSAAGQHTLTFRNGTKYTFEVPVGSLKATPNLIARLKFIDNPWGDRLTLNYDASGRLSTVTDNLGIAGRTGLVFTYFPDNHLKDITDWSGRKWGFTYTANDLTGAVNPLNQARIYTYETGHLLHDVVQPLQRGTVFVKTTFNYYRNGRTFNYHDALGNTETLDYDLYRKSTRVTDPRGGIREYDYDADGRMTKLIEPDGAVLIFENQGDGIRSKKFDALGYPTTYSYRLDKAFTGPSDLFGNVSREQDALNQATDTSYGPFDQVATVKDPRGTIATTSFYTAAGTCAVVGKPKDQRISILNGTANVLLKDFCWNANGTRQSQNEYIDPANLARKRVTTYTYEAGSNGLNVADVNVTGSGQTLHSHFTYDTLGRKKTETVDRRTSATVATLLALTTTYEYDSLDRTTKVTDPEGHIKETVFDANGQVSFEKTWYPTATAKAGCAAPVGGYVVCTDASHQYDAADRRISTTDVLGNTTSFGYDEAGNLAKVTDANGHVTQYEYDPMNRKAATIDGNGQRTDTKYDLKGQPIAVTNANGETSKSEYDAIGRLTKTINPLGFETRFQYDANGNQTCQIDANATSLATDPGHQPVNAQGCTETRVYDELNRLVQIKDAQNNVTATSYDLLGNRTTLTDAENHVTTFKYDDLGRMVELVDPLIEAPTDKTQLFIYDEASNRIQETDRKGQVTRYTYDKLNRNAQSDHLADLSGETAIYDAFGDLVQTQNGAVTYTYAYNAKHQLVGKADSRSTRTLGWSYDLVGNVAAKVDYQGDITGYQYDSANRLVAETNPAYLQVSYHYDGAGRPLDRTLSNGARTHYGWDSAGRLTQLQNTTVTGQSVNSTTYTRDRIGNILTQTDSNPANSISFSYDPEYRLLSADSTGTANDEAYGYDKVGNRKSYTKGALVPIASSRFSNYNSGNRLTDTRTGSTTGTVFESYGYDDNGSLTTVSGNRNLTLTWDANNRVKQVGSITFNYDPSDYRIKKVGTITKNYYLEGEHLEAVYDNAGIVQAQYFRGSVIDEVVNGYQKDAANKSVNFTFHHDTLQSVLGLSGHEGSVLNTQGYSPFGTSLSQTGTATNSLQYTGREIDTETGFYYYRARYYDPIIGRFISEDPMGFGAEDVNFYAYTGNNPVNANDPSGNCPSCIGAGVSVLTGGIIRGITSGGDLGSIFNTRAILQDAALGAIGAGLANKISTLNQLSKVFSAPVPGKVLGQIGENLAGISSIGKTGIQVNGRLRFPDALNGFNITEVKNVLSISARDAAQISDFVRYSGQQGMTTLLTRGSATNISRVQGLVDNGLLAIGKIPGINSSGVANLSRSVSSGIGFGAGAAGNGGFLLYPNKSNSNMTQSVYSK